MIRLAVLVAVVNGALGSPPPTSLQAERLTDPPAVDTHRPRFSWKLPATSSASATDVPARQVAYQIQASPTALFSALLWDSGETASNKTLDIEYGAAGGALLGASELVADQRVWWRVRVWTAATAADGGTATGGEATHSTRRTTPRTPASSMADPVPSAWSAAAFFRVGRSLDVHWTGTWIAGTSAQSTHSSSPSHASASSLPSSPPATNCSGSPYDDHPNPLLRRVFFLDQDPSRIAAATLYAAGLGYYRLFLDGTHAIEDRHTEFRLKREIHLRPG